MGIINKLKEGLQIPVPGNKDVRVISFCTQDFDGDLNTELGFVLCSRESFRDKYVVWRYRLTNGNLALYAGYYFQNKNDAIEHYNDCIK